MLIHNIKYIAVDLDGTLLGNDHEVSYTSRKVMEEIQRKGIKLILCSGRSSASMRYIAEDVNLYKYRGYIVSYNGGTAFQIDENGQEKKLFSKIFEKQKVQEILNLVGEDTENYVVCSHDHMSLKKHDEGFEKTCKRANQKYDFGQINDAFKLLLIDKPEYIKNNFERIRNKLLNLDPSINVFTSSPNLIEITPDGASKGEGLKKLFSLINASPDNLIVFGDQGNDISMFQYAKYSVAVDNAIPELKAIAKYQTLKNTEDGVARFILKNILNIGEN